MTPNLWTVVHVCQNESSLDGIGVLKAVSSRHKPAAGHQRRSTNMTIALHLKADLPRPRACLRICATHNLCPLPGPRATTCIWRIQTSEMPANSLAVIALNMYFFKHAHHSATHRNRLCNLWCRHTLDSSYLSTFRWHIWRRRESILLKLQIIRQTKYFIKLNK